MPSLNVNSDAIIRHVNRLQMLNRSAFPVAVRQTLSDMAFNVKLETMPKTAAVFKKRQPNFFKANSKAEPAQGFDVSKMKSTVGFYENKLNIQPTNFAVKDLEQQEQGGAIKGKAFIAMKNARGGGGLVRNNFRLSTQDHGKFITANDSRNRKQGFIRAAFMAVKLNPGNAFVLGNVDSKGSRTLSLIQEIWGSTRRQGLRSSRKLMIKRIPIFRVKRGRAISVKATGFMKRASLESGAKASEYFIKNAQKQFEKFAK